MYILVIGWVYVALMMAVAEAMHSNGTVLGGIITFVLYGLGPVALVVYLMLAPQRRRVRLEREAAEAAQLAQEASGLPDAGGHAARAAEPGSVAAVGKEP